LPRLNVVLGIAAVCVSVCSCNGPIYEPERRTFPDTITPPARWIVTGNVQSPAKAIDGNVATAAIGPQGQANGWIVIDLGKICLLNMVVIDHGPDEFGYCRELAVQTSDDGQTWTLQAVVPGLRRVTNCLFTGPELARYVKLQCLTPGARPWSVAEIYIN